MLQQLLDKQNSFEQQHKDLEKKVLNLENKMESPTSSSAESGKRKRVVTRDRV